MSPMKPAADDAQAAYPLVYRNLMTVGLLGAMYRCHEDEALINTAVELTLANPQEFGMCRAIAQGLGGDAEPVGTTLERHIEENPDDDGAKVALATALVLAGDARWKPILEGVLAISVDARVRQAASGMLQFGLQRHAIGR